jgi:uridine kinase
MMKTTRDVRPGETAKKAPDVLSAASSLRRLAAAVAVAAVRIQNRDTHDAVLFGLDSGTFAGDQPHRFCPMKPLIIGIAGGSGSGKSTVARKITEALSPASAAFIDMDAYYRNHAELTLEERRRVNWDHPEAFDLDLLASHLAALARGEAIEKPVYDFVSHLREERTVHIPPRDVVVIDGILLFVEEAVRRSCDVKVFVDTDADVRLIRRIRRDMSKRGRPLEEILEQYLTTVQPMHLQFVEPSKRYADIIVPRGGHNTVAIELIVATITRRFRGGTQ